MHIVSRTSLSMLAAAAAALSGGQVMAQNTVDPTLLDVTAAGGQVNSVVASSRLSCCGGPDDPNEAFGQAAGPIEPGSFLFEDNGAGGTESLTFTTAIPVTLTGLQIQGGAAGGGAGDPRTIGAITVEADTGGGFTQVGTLADFPDTAQGGTGTAQILFNSAVTGSNFRVTLETPEQGSRITEIDAIVPEPAALSLLGLGGLTLLARRHRRR